jgi:hypothetical protein
VTGQLFEPKREFCCSCGWRCPWDWSEFDAAHMRRHRLRNEYDAVWWIEIDGEAQDRKRSRLPARKETA